MSLVLWILGAGFLLLLVMGELLLILRTAKLLLLFVVSELEGKDG